MEGEGSSSSSSGGGGSVNLKLNLSVTCIRQPATLFNLCIQSWTTKLSSFTEKVIRSYPKGGYPIYRKLQIKIECRQFHDWLIRYIPSGFADEVTERFLDDMRDSFSKLWDVEKYLPMERRLYPIILTAVMHPAAAAVKYAKIREDSHCIQIDGFTTLYVTNSADLIRWDRDPSDVKKYYCSGKNARNLRVSTIQNREDKLHLINVTDLNVQYLVNVPNLEKMKLHISYLTEEEIYQLFSNLTDGWGGHLLAYKLQDVSIAYPNENVFQNTITLLPNLRSLTLTNTYNQNFSLNPILLLVHLTSLTLHFFDYSCVKNLLEDIGYRLTYLEICDIVIGDLIHIGTFCKSLKCFHCGISNFKNMTYCQMHNYHRVMQLLVPTFETVECLRLHYPFDSDFARDFAETFPNLKSLFVPHHNSSSQLSVCIDHLRLKNQKLKYLSTEGVYNGYEVLIGGKVAEIGVYNCMGLIRTDFKKNYECELD